ncbi:flagellum-specific ATP synthase [Candidatus Kuenenia stuttgartiensis]|uniref:Flagellum-specific ATP synthase n=1 Tax=Kuenenia stuttgartiensis TaxID=174633 RepID=Q1Q6R8_KUEST|nr:MULTISPECIES: flagellar protein export ATPase FliI [Kuenenia]MBE7548925.1 flagellar protein export ATPase FliI [Planctomycetia bacterium]MCF6153023.1 flagellar protein export ATPase FliI [Candidatus Kuenenia stuttgartiensis]MCL4727961.1 flagellar protein export ATPase FliI [Candidatus Kuenenia stuttgartiensis]MCZ7622443.1 flagellar protein export ATPase FliI [Candidatus Kuenenia sp.]QII12922.1 flagellum-specific ATP synthase [Candidatus Kuenenia stuttgartiensis]
MATPCIDFALHKKRVSESVLVQRTGRVAHIAGLVIESNGPSVPVGELCYIHSNNGETPIPAEVVGFKEKRILLMPIGELERIGPGNRVTASGSPLTVGVGMGLMGRILGGLGEPMDGKGPLNVEERVSIYNSPPDPLTRSRIKEVLETGVRAIDGMLTFGQGQRLGIFAGSGVGKSTLMGMIARNSGAEVNVIALIGERGREVREFVEKNLGEEGMKKSVIVSVTSDKPALLRVKGAYIASSIAEYFRDRGMRVLLMMDSVTRFANAQREIGLAIGEPPTSKGYTPSVFALLPKLLERSGTGTKGSITGLYTVLVDGDDMNEPIADAVRGILDGHVVLSRAMASQNHYPAIDIMESVSRCMDDIITGEHRKAAQMLKAVYATYKEAEDMINIGAYAKGGNKKIDYALSVIDAINEYLKQDMTTNGNFNESISKLSALFT